MSVTDGTVTSGSVAGGSNKTLANVVVDAGHNAMFVAIHEPSGGFPSDTTAVSWGSVNFVRILSDSTGNLQSVDTWIGVGLTPGTGSLTFSSGHGSTKDFACISLGGVDTGTPTGTASHIESASNLNNSAVATTAGGYLIGALVAEATPTITAQNSQTQLYDTLISTTGFHVGKQTAAGTSTQDRYTLTGTGTHWGALVSVQINAASASSITVTPTGIALTSSLGTPAPVEVLPVTGFAITSALGTPSLSLQGNLIESPTGVAGTFSVGTFTVQNDITMAPNGGTISLPLGTVSITADSLQTPVGSSASFSIGAPVIGVTIPPTGLAITTTLGTATPILGTIVVPTGVSMISAVGAVVFQGTVVVTPTMAAVTSTLGTPSIQGTSLQAPTGFAVTSSVGTPVPAVSAITLQPTGFFLQALFRIPQITGAVSSGGAAAGQRRRQKGGWVSSD